MDVFTRADKLKQEWVDKYVTVTDKPELKRFAGIVGRVVTVNFNGKALVDFQDGGWYDISANTDYLTLVDPAEGAAEIQERQQRPGHSGKARRLIE